VSLVAAFCPLGQERVWLLGFTQLRRALIIGFEGWLAAVFVYNKAATKSRYAITNVVTSKMLRRKKTRKLPGNSMKIDPDEKQAPKDRHCEKERVGVIS